MSTDLRIRVVPRSPTSRRQRGTPAPIRRIRNLKIAPITRSSRTLFCPRLEASGSATARTGWQPQHLVAETEDGAVARRRALLSEIALARRIRVRSPAGPRPMSAPAAATTRSCRCRCRSRPRPAGACWCAPARDAERIREALAAGPDRTLPSCAKPPRCMSPSRRKPNGDLLGAHGFLQRNDQQFHWENARLRDLRRFPRRARGAQAQGDPARAARGARARHRGASGSPARI